MGKSHILYLFGFPSSRNTAQCILNEHHYLVVHFYVIYNVNDFKTIYFSGNFSYSIKPYKLEGHLI